MPFDPIAATPAAPARLKPWSAGRVVESNRAETPPTIPPRVNKYEVGLGRPHPIAPAVIAWAKSCFAGGLTARPGDLSALIEEASEAARNDFDEASTRQWADGYVFPPETGRKAPE
jgi:hypothetical protein